jgi:hypothetical protein
MFGPWDFSKVGKPGLGHDQIFPLISTLHRSSEAQAGSAATANLIFHDLPCWINEHLIPLRLTQVKAMT